MLPEQAIIRALGRELPSNRRVDCMRRFTYIRLDVQQLQFQELDAIAKRVFGIPAASIDHVHAGFPCRTTSKVSVQTPRHRGFLPHSWPDGRPRSELAHADDELLASIMNLFLELRRLEPDMLLTIEQPENEMFLKLQPAQRLLSAGWIILRGSHCRAASSWLDRQWQNNDVLLRVN